MGDLVLFSTVNLTLKRHQLEPHKGSQTFSDGEIVIFPQVKIQQLASSFGSALKHRVDPGHFEGQHPCVALTPPINAV